MVIDNLKRTEDDIAREEMEHLVNEAVDKAAHNLAHGYAWLDEFNKLIADIEEELNKDHEHKP